MSVYGAAPPLRGLAFYDAQCPLCRGLLARLGAPFQRRGVVFLPLQQACATLDAPFPPEAFQREMKLLLADGTWHGGADAWIRLALAVAWLRPLAWLALLPGCRALAHLLYRQLAAHRHCLDGGCPRTRSRPARDRALLLVLLPALALCTAGLVAPWLLMWLLALALFLGCKWLTWRDAVRHHGPPPQRVRALFYLCLWPGMDPTPFWYRAKAARPRREAWAPPVIKLLIGAGLVWLAAPLLDPAHRLAAGWTGMVGIMMMLHFGLFHLLALFWQSRGFAVAPLMEKPLLARSMADLWSRRWNRGFQYLARHYCFAAIQPRLGPVAALLATFLASGLIHEWVITVPAGAGYGGPTLYFLLQGIVLALVRTRPARRWKLDHGLRGRLVMMITALVPVGLLFPPPFIERVILPMLAGLGAI